MKRTTKTLLALLAAAATLLSLAACGSNKSGPDTPLLQGIFDKLTANVEYAQWKTSFNATTIEEKLEGDSIVISAKGEEGVNGVYEFTLDGDYIVNTAEEGDYTAYSFMTFLKDAVADYYDMNNLLITGYLAGLDFAEKENAFFKSESVDGKTVLKLYAASAWDMQGLDEMFIDDAALEYVDALTDASINTFVNSGKITVGIWGSKEDLSLVVGEYGGNTELTLQSLQNVVAKLQPNGYEAFAADYTELEAVTGSEYTVQMKLSQDIAENHAYTGAEGYSYVTVTFSPSSAS